MTFNVYGKKPNETQLKSLLSNKKTLIKGLISKKTNKTYDAYFTPKGIQEYQYNGKTGYSWQFDMEFPKKSNTKAK